jgi:predicted nucleic acid-binding Zn ribbon protein
MDRTDRYQRTHFARYPSSRERRREQTLTEWYGAEQAPGEISARRSQARPVAAIVDETLRQLGFGDACILEQVRGLWPALVGPDVARRAEPIAFRDSVVSIEVRSAAWLYVLEREQRERIRDRVREATDGAVKDVRFVPPGRFAGPPGGPSGTGSANGA